MKATFKYPVVIYLAEEGGFVAEIPALKGCLAQGETMIECLEELETVSALWLESAKRHHQKIPSAAKVVARLREMTL